MSNPRSTFSFAGIHASRVSGPSDGTIVVPTLGPNGLVPTMSAQLGLVAVLINTGTAGPTFGLGAAGATVAGVIDAVDQDGVVTIRDFGFAYVPYVTGGTQPTPGNPVEADGTGKVRLSTTKFNAICWGFGINPVARQASEDGLLRCIVRFL